MRETGLVHSSGGAPPSELWGVVGQSGAQSHWPCGQRVCMGHLSTGTWGLPARAGPRSVLVQS